MIAAALAAGHAVLRDLRHAVGQDRPQADHPGRHGAGAARPTSRSSRASPRAAQPGAGAAQANAQIIVKADPATCSFQGNPVAREIDFTSLVRHRQARADRQLGQLHQRGAAGRLAAVVTIGDKTLTRPRARWPPAATSSTRRRARRSPRFKKEVAETLKGAGYPAKAEPDRGVQRPVADDRRPAVDPDDLRDDGLRPDRGDAGGAVPDAHPLHLDEPAVPHRQRLVRRPAAVDHASPWSRRTATCSTACGIRSCIAAVCFVIGAAVHQGNQGRRHLRPRLTRAETLTGMGPSRAHFSWWRRAFDANSQGLAAAWARHAQGMTVQCTMGRHRRRQDRRDPCADATPARREARHLPRVLRWAGRPTTAPAAGAGMAEQDLLDDDLRALDQVAEERGAAGLPTLQAAVERMRHEGDRDRLMWALPPLARAYALCEKFDEAEAAANEALAHFRVNGSVRGPGVRAQRAGAGGHPPRRAHARAGGRRRGRGAGARRRGSDPAGAHRQHAGHRAQRHRPAGRGRADLRGRPARRARLPGRGRWCCGCAPTCRSRWAAGR